MELHQLAFSIKKRSTKWEKERREKVFTDFFSSSFVFSQNYTAGKRNKVVKLHKAIWHQSKFKEVLRVEIKLDLNSSKGRSNLLSARRVFLAVTTTLLKILMLLYIKFHVAKPHQHKIFSKKLRFCCREKLRVFKICSQGNFYVKSKWKLRKLACSDSILVMLFLKIKKFFFSNIAHRFHIQFFSYFFISPKFINIPPLHTRLAKRYIYWYSYVRKSDVYAC